MVIRRVHVFQNSFFLSTTTGLRVQTCNVSTVHMLLMFIWLIMGRSMQHSTSKSKLLQLADSITVLVVMAGLYPV